MITVAVSFTDGMLSPSVSHGINTAHQHCTSSKHQHIFNIRLEIAFPHREWVANVVWVSMGPLPLTLPRRASCVYASFPFRLRFPEPIQFFSIYPGHLSAGGLARPSQVNARYTEQYFELQIGWAANMCSHLLCCCAPIDDVQESRGKLVYGFASRCIHTFSMTYIS